MGLLRSMSLAALCLAPAAGGPHQPAPRVAVLEFDLKDYTPTPNSPAEIAETRDAARLLRQSLATTCGYTVVPVDSAAQRALEEGSADYLFLHPAESARLGKAVRAEWVVMGELTVSSPIVSELHVELIRVNRGTLAGAVAIELKGDPSEEGDMFATAIDAVARQIDRLLPQPGKGEAAPRCAPAG